MTRFVPAWQRKKMAEAEARRNAPPVPGHTLSALVSKLGDHETDADKRAYLRDCINKGLISEAGGAHVAKVVGLSWTA